jgi:hypothetical protein
VIKAVIRQWVIMLAISILIPLSSHPAVADVTVIPSPLEGFAESFQRGMGLGIQQRRLRLLEEQAKRINIQERLLQELNLRYSPQYREALYKLQVGKPEIPPPPPGAFEKFGIPEGREFENLPTEEIERMLGLR